MDMERWRWIGLLGLALLLWSPHVSIKSIGVVTQSAWTLRSRSGRKEVPYLLSESSDSSSMVSHEALVANDTDRVRLVGLLLWVGFDEALGRVCCCFSE